jgi:hypothetical protein
LINGPDTISTVFKAKADCGTGVEKLQNRNRPIPEEETTMIRTMMFLGAVVLALTLVAPVSRATQVLYRSPQQLGTESALVVSGEVAGVRSYWNESHTKIFTEASISVSDTYKGAAGRSIRVVQLGGVVGHVRMTVHGALSWSPGEEVLLFLEPSAGGAWRVSGFFQGKYDIVRDEGGRPFVKNAPGESKVVGSASAEGRLRRSGPVALGEFVDRALGRND